MLHHNILSNFLPLKIKLLLNLGSGLILSEADGPSSSVLRKMDSLLALLTDPPGGLRVGTAHSVCLAKEDEAKSTAVEMTCKLMILLLASLLHAAEGKGTCFFSVNICWAAE